MSWFEQDGSVDWKCSDCGEEGTQPFTNLRTAKESPTIAEYEAVIVDTEVAHALKGCNGRLVSGGGFRYRMVEHKEAS